MNKKYLVLVVLNTTWLPLILLAIGIRDASLIAGAAIFGLSLFGGYLVWLWRVAPQGLKLTLLFSGEFPQDAHLLFRQGQPIGNTIETAGITVVSAVPPIAAATLYAACPYPRKWLFPIFEDTVGNYVCFVGGGPGQGTYVYASPPGSSEAFEPWLLAKDTPELAQLMQPSSA